MKSLRKMRIEINPTMKKRIEKEIYFGIFIKEMHD